MRMRHRMQLLRVRFVRKFVPDTKPSMSMPFRSTEVRHVLCSMSPSVPSRRGRRSLSMMVMSSWARASLNPRVRLRRRDVIRRFLAPFILLFILFLFGAAVAAPLPITINANARYHRVAAKIGTICEAQGPRIAAELGLTRLEPIEIDVVDDVHAYNREHGGRLPEWGIAFAVLEENRIIVDVKRATREFNSLDEVVPHELSHILVHQRAPDVHFPLWFLEGCAQWQAREWSMVDQWELVQGVWQHSSPRLADMYGRYPAEETRAQQAYRVAYAGFTDLFAEVGFDDLAPFLAEVERQRSFENGFRAYFGYSVAEYQAFFQDLSLIHI